MIIIIIIIGSRAPPLSVSARPKMSAGLAGSSARSPTSSSGEQAAGTRDHNRLVAHPSAPARARSAGARSAAAETGRGGEKYGQLRPNGPARRGRAARPFDWATVYLLLALDAPLRFHLPFCLLLLGPRCSLLAPRPPGYSDTRPQSPKGTARCQLASLLFHFV